MQRTVRVICSEAIELETALEAEIWASALLGMFWEHAPLDDNDTDLGPADPLIEEITRREDAGALAALLAIGNVADSEPWLLALRRSEELIAAGITPPSWAKAILKTEILRTAVMREEVFDDGVTILIEATHDGEDRHAIGVYIDHNLGVMAKDILLAESIDQVEGIMRRQPQDDGVLQIEPIEPAEACARIYAAMALTDMTIGPPVAEDYARLRALALLRADELRGGPVDIDVPEVSVEERDDLMTQFLASPEAAGFAADSDEAYVARLAIDYCANYVDGRPLRWSPVTVELFMTHWVPRKVLGESCLFEAVPAGLEAWIRWAGRQRQAPDWAVEQTVESISRWTSEMLEAASDDSAGGPAKQFLAAAKDAGVDLADEEALASFIAGWNARSEVA